MQRPLAHLRIMRNRAPIHCPVLEWRLETGRRLETTALGAAEWDMSGMSFGFSFLRRKRRVILKHGLIAATPSGVMKSEVVKSGNAECGSGGSSDDTGSAVLTPRIRG